MRKVLTYGTFDLLHYGHIEILRRAKELGDYLVVAVSTDEFNEIKGKKAYHNYDIRKKMLEAIRYVDEVIPEKNWNQKPEDVFEMNKNLITAIDELSKDTKLKGVRNAYELQSLDLLRENKEMKR